MNYFNWVYTRAIKPTTDGFKEALQCILQVPYAIAVYGWIGWLVWWGVTIMDFTGQEGYSINGVFVYMNQTPTGEIWVASNTGYCFLILVGWIFVASIVYWYVNIRDDC